MIKLTAPLWLLGIPLRTYRLTVKYKTVIERIYKKFYKINNFSKQLCCTY